MSGSGKTVSALMGWNVNLNIYHRVQSKLLHGRGGKEGEKWLPVPVGPRQETWGHCQRGSCRVSVTTSWLSAAAPQGTRGAGGLTPLNRLQMKSEKQVDVTNETR